MQLRQHAVAMLLGASVLCGVLWIALKAFTEHGIGPLTVITISYGIAALLLTPWALSSLRGAPQRWHVLLLTALLGGSTCMQRRCE